LFLHAHNKRINTRCARQGQKNVGSLRFAWYCSLRIFARYAGVRAKGLFPPVIILKEEPPNAIDFASIRKAIGWKNPELLFVQRSIDSSLFWVSLYLDNELVGCGRVIGDNSMFFYIQDIIVHPKHQRLGLGSK
jgi:hypothetical protein